MASGKGALQNRLFYEPIIVRSNTQSYKHTHPPTRIYTDNENVNTGHAIVGAKCSGPQKEESEEHSWDGGDRERQMERLGRDSSQCLPFLSVFSEYIIIQSWSSAWQHFGNTLTFPFLFSHTHFLTFGAAHIQNFHKHINTLLYKSLGLVRCFY